MEGIIAEDAAHGEIGCGRDWGNKFSVYLNTCGINVSHEKLMGLLQEYLGSVLMEPDLERIFQLITRFIEPLVVETHIQYRNPQSITQLSLVEKIPEHVPSEKIREILVGDLGDYLGATEIEHIIQVSHQAIHKAVLRPRHTWPDPMWVMRTPTKIYVAQAQTSDEAIAKVKQSHPQEQAEIQLIAVRGVLAPDQVIVLDKDQFL